jgi:hypothetical protein
VGYADAITAIACKQAMPSQVVLMLSTNGSFNPLFVGSHPYISVQTGHTGCGLSLGLPPLVSFSFDI